jgi:hypothetical protein
MTRPSSDLDFHAHESTHVGPKSYFIFPAARILVLRWPVESLPAREVLGAVRFSAAREFLTRSGFSLLEFGFQRGGSSVRCPSSIFYTDFILVPASPLGFWVRARERSKAKKEGSDSEELGGGAWRPSERCNMVVGVPPHHRLVIVWAVADAPFYSWMRCGFWLCRWVLELMSKNTHAECPAKQSTPSCFFAVLPVSVPAWFVSMFGHRLLKSNCFIGTCILVFPFLLSQRSVRMVNQLTALLAGLQLLSCFGAWSKVFVFSLSLRLCGSRFGENCCRWEPVLFSSCWIKGSSFSGSRSTLVVGSRSH